MYTYEKNEISKISSAVSIALKKKCKCTDVKVKNVLNNVDVNYVIQVDEGYRFLKNIRSSPAHWESEKKKVYVMIRQFGLLSVFVTLSVSESKRPELLRILKSNVDSIEISAEEAINLSFNGKAKLIQSDAATCVLYFWNAFKQLFKTWRSINGPFGKHTIEHHYFRIITGAPTRAYVLMVKKCSNFQRD